MEGVKNLEMQRRRTLRRTGSGGIGAIGRADLGTGEALWAAMVGRSYQTLPVVVGSKPNLLSTLRLSRAYDAVAYGDRFGKSGVCVGDRRSDRVIRFPDFTMRWDVAPVFAAVECPVAAIRSV